MCFKQKNKAGEERDLSGGGDINLVMSDKEGPLDVVTCEQRSAGRVMKIFRGEQFKIGEWDMQRP